AGRALFDDVSLQVNRGDRIGLVGPNGAGKSTLFALLLGDVSPDNGTIAIEKNATIGFLPQETAATGDETVLELALAVSPALVDEPTNHLDLESLQWFQEYLRSYPGAIVMISHDREFLNQLVGSIVEIAHSKLVRYRGDWDSYIEQKAAREEQQLAAYKNQQK